MVFREEKRLNMRVKQSYRFAVHCGQKLENWAMKR